MSFIVGSMDRIFIEMKKKTKRKLPKHVIGYITTYLTQKRCGGGGLRRWQTIIIYTKKKRVKMNKIATGNEIFFYFKFYLLIMMISLF